MIDCQRSDQLSEYNWRHSTIDKAFHYLFLKVQEKVMTLHDEYSSCYYYFPFDSQIL